MLIVVDQTVTEQQYNFRACVILIVVDHTVTEQQ